MATESTAIVNLLDLVKSKPMPMDSGDDVLFGGRARFDPMAMPVAAQPIMLPQPFVHQPTPALDHLKTHRVTKVAPSALKKFALPVGLFVVTMVLFSIYLAKGDKKAAAPKATIVHAPAPAVQMPVVQTPAPAPTPPPVVAAAAPVVTPIESNEPTVTPIETPAAAEPTVPTVPAVAAVAETEPEAAPVASPAPSSAIAKKHRHRAAARTSKKTKHEKRVAMADEPKPAAEPKPAKAEKLGGKGALALSSSPAREVWIDGRNTKQMTPQRMTLVPGTHNVTLVDKKTHGAKTFQVEIEANKTLKIAKSY